MHIVEPKAAATVVLCRNIIRWPCEVLLIKRSPNAKFLPGAHVFPGGQVTEQDHQQASFYALDQLNLNRISNYFLKPIPILASFIAAAVRETLEESGISILNFKIDQSPDLSNLWPISWWITPPEEKYRFDTWFFLADINDSHINSSFSKEASLENIESCWLKAAHALEFHEEGQIFLAPPTRSVLERLAHSDSLEELLSYVDRPLKPILPRFVNYKHQKLLVLPGHELHEDSEKSKFIMKTSYVFKLL